jgi:hypothetical protein
VSKRQGASVLPGDRDNCPIGLDGLRVRRSVRGLSTLMGLLGEIRMSASSSGRFFYRFVVPAAVALNLGLGLVVLNTLRPDGWLGWLEVGTGAFCCVVSGWLAASAWSKSYWGSAMARQINVWRQIADAIFAWLEETQLPADALQPLKRSLDEVVRQPGSGSN